METRARLKLNKLVQPILEQVEGERKVRAEMQIIYSQILNRLKNVEKLLGICNNKPKMVEDLEIGLVELRAELFMKVAECEMHVNEATQEQERQMV